MKKRCHREHSVLCQALPGEAGDKLSGRERKGKIFVKELTLH